MFCVLILSVWITLFYLYGICFYFCVLFICFVWLFVCVYHVYVLMWFVYIVWFMWFVQALTDCVFSSSSSGVCYIYR